METKQNIKIRLYRTKHDHNSSLPSRTMCPCALTDILSVEGEGFGGRCGACDG